MEKSNMKIKAVIGLGNPGEQYKNTYHNVGALAVSHILKELGGDISSFQKPSKKDFEFVEFREIIFSKSLVFMNNSGKAVNDFIKYFNIKPEELMLFHDDSDMFIGKYKISFDQSSGGHKGIQSIIDTLKTQKLQRCKIGIRPEDKMIKEGPERKTRRKKAEEFVLKKITKENLSILKNIFNEISKNI